MSTLTCYRSPKSTTLVTIQGFTPWTEAYAYVIVLDNKKFITGYKQVHYRKLIRDSEKSHFHPENFLDWEQIPFKEIANICQYDLMKKMTDKFPWSETRWGSEEAFKISHIPPSLNNEITKSINYSNYFCKFSLTDTWKNAILEKWNYQVIVTTDETLTEDIVRIYDKYYFVREGKKTDGTRWATLTHITQLDTTEHPKAEKEYLDHCYNLAHKYGTTFEVSFKCFKGNEEEIKIFLETLKNAIGKPYNEKELCRNKKRRRDEIKRLGINTSYRDSSLIAPYILQCLKAGEIVKEKTRS